MSNAIDEERGGTFDSALQPAAHVLLHFAANNAGHGGLG
jgi:hypothetical protein